MEQGENISAFCILDNYTDYLILPTISHSECMCMIRLNAILGHTEHLLKIDDKDFEKKYTIKEINITIKY